MTGGWRRGKEEDGQGEDGGTTTPFTNRALTSILQAYDQCTYVTQALSHDDEPCWVIELSPSANMSHSLSSTHLHSISVRTVNVAVEGIMVSSLCLNKQHNQSYRANKNKNRQNYKTWKLQKYKKNTKTIKKNELNNCLATGLPNTMFYTYFRRYKILLWCHCNKPTYYDLYMTMFAAQNTCNWSNASDPERTVFFDRSNRKEANVTKILQRSNTFSVQQQETAGYDRVC